jgi:tetratricopeptide (TPR) repeat protein
MSENIERLKRARELYQQEHYSEAAVLYHQLIDAAGNAPAQVKELWVELAWAYFHIQRFESTLICLKQVWQDAGDYPHLDDVYLLAARCHNLLNRTQRALDVLQRGLEVSQVASVKQAEILTELGQTYFQRGEYPLAVKPLQQAQEIYQYSDDDEALARVEYALGFTHYYLQQYTQADEHFNALMALTDEREVQALGIYGKAFIEHNFGQHEAVIKSIEKVLTLHPDFNDRESLAYLMCRSYKGLQDHVHFDMFFRELKENYPQGRYQQYYEELENW